MSSSMIMSSGDAPLSSNGMIIFMIYIIQDIDYSQMYTNLIIIISSIIAITAVLLV